tara:strand:+ start:358 stop:1092 length:735 start_codon:yes stop_codon:yes gene_type:complete
VKNNFFKKPVTNINLRPSSNSEVVSQILYGEKFKILSKRKNWIKIKTYFDNYTGFIKNSGYNKNFNPKYKIYKIKSQIYKKNKNKFLPMKNSLYFASGISIKNIHKKYIEFEKNKWIKRNDLKDIKHCEKNFSKIFKLFLNTKYLWGGKTVNGIDCSALIQIFFYYNRIFFPRDTKDQIKFCKKKKIKFLRKKDIIFWKGHVAFCLTKKKLIHAYGPKKKVLIMDINKTIDRIFRTTKLKPIKL